MPFFLIIVHPGNCRSRKRSGTPFRCALAQLEIAPSKDVFCVGDTEDDAAGALFCGVSFAWASFGYGIKPNFDCIVFQDLHAGP